MHEQPAHLYTLEIYLYDSDDLLLDVYRLKVGVRKLEWNNSTLLMNNKPLYLRGFGRHEDSDVSSIVVGISKRLNISKSLNIIVVTKCVSEY